MKCINSLKNERNCRSAYVSLKTPISSLSVIEQNYAKLLTPFAFQHIQKQLSDCDKIHIIQLVDASTVLVKSNSLGNIAVGATSCPCSFFTSILLPCKHIFAVRQYLKLSFFEESLCGKRWTQTYLKENHRVYQKAVTNESDDDADEAISIGFCP